MSDAPSVQWKIYFVLQVMLNQCEIDEKEILTIIKLLIMTTYMVLFIYITRLHSEIRNSHICYYRNL